MNHLYCIESFGGLKSYILAGGDVAAVLAVLRANRPEAEVSYLGAVEQLAAGE